MTVKEKVSLFLKNLMKALDVDKKTLAELLEVSLSELEEFLKGNKVPKVEVLMRIAKLGKVSLDELIRPDIPLPEPQNGKLSVKLKNVKAKGNVIVGKRVGLTKRTSVKKSSGFVEIEEEEKIIVADLKGFDVSLENVNANGTLIIGSDLQVIKKSKRNKRFRI